MKIIDRAKFRRRRALYLGVALADDDGAGLGGLVAVDLDAEPLPVGVATILGAPGPLLVRHLDRHRARQGEGDGWPVAEIPR